ncbi:MAG TPA: DUF5591 domain-containing protein [Planctomycetota bacterium]|nr:DUF5591 domain-containing protein [Planctomycetota bacterium]
MDLGKILHRTHAARRPPFEQQLAALMAPLEARDGPRFDVEGDAATAWHDFILRRYTPPEGKRFLVFFQCSVGRPFYRSSSHGTIRRAVSAATGCDAYKDFDRCPVHVVVLASMIGPVPYELQEVYPANVPGGGVKHFSPEHYEQVRPILARRMADYITTHGSRYERIATFTDGRYGEVMADAARLAGVEFPIFPIKRGPRVLHIDGSPPRTYWQKYWIQLCLEITSWLDPPQRSRAEARLRRQRVVYR